MIDVTLDALSGALQQLALRTAFDSIEAGLLPAPPHAEHPGDHLLVNCWSSHFPGIYSPEFLLETARRDTLSVLKEVVGTAELDAIASVCISLAVFLVPPRDMRRRLYRFSILTESLPRDPDEIDPSIFAAFPNTWQSSELPPIAALLSGT